MARFDTAFDATGIEPTTGYDVLPAGKYRAQIVESEMRVTRNGMGQFLWLMLDIIEGPYQGRKLFDQLNLVNRNEQTVEIAQRTLSAICHAVGQVHVSDSEQLHFKPLIVTLKVEPAGTSTNALLNFESDFVLHRIFIHRCAMQLRCVKSLAFQPCLIFWGH